MRNDIGQVKNDTNLSVLTEIEFGVFFLINDSRV